MEWQQIFLSFQNSSRDSSQFKKFCGLYSSLDSPDFFQNR